MSNEGGPKGDSEDSKGGSVDSNADGGDVTDENECDGEDSEATGSDEPNATEKLMIVQGERIACYWCDRRHVIAHALQRSR